MLTFAFSGDTVSNGLTGAPLRDTINRLFEPQVHVANTSIMSLPLNLFLAGGDNWLYNNTTSGFSFIRYRFEDATNTGAAGDPAREYEMHFSLAVDPAVTTNRNEILRIGNTIASNENSPSTASNMLCRIFWTNANDGTGLQRLQLTVNNVDITTIPIVYAIDDEPVYLVVRARSRSGDGSVDDSRLELYVNGNNFYSQDQHSVVATRFPWMHNQQGRLGADLLSAGRTAIRNVQAYDAWTTADDVPPALNYVFDASPTVGASVGYAVTNAATADDALSDNDELSYLSTSTPGAQLELDYSLPAELQNENLVAVHNRARAARGVDPNTLEFVHTLSLIHI